MHTDSCFVICFPSLAHSMYKKKNTWHGMCIEAHGYADAVQSTLSFDYIKLINDFLVFEKMYCLEFADENGLQRGDA